MQLNPGVKTIEAELFSAICQAGFVHPSNASDPKKVAWMRACRTDKGVHAAGQVVSLKMEMAMAKEEIKAKLNELLPKDIRIFGVLETAGSFHSKERCDSRVYEYVMPTYVFELIDRVAFFSPKIISPEDSSSDESEAQRRPKEAYQDFVPTEQDAERIRSFRLSSEQLAKIELLFSCYQGTHSFHNFTPGKSSTEQSAQRFIRNTRLYDPFTDAPEDNSTSGKLFYQPDGTEWVSVQLHGNSFMLHQIRKMVGLVIWIMKLGGSDAIVKQMFQAARFNVPKAPSLGLFLDRAIFDAYNRKFSGIREPIDFTPASFEAECKKLKNDLIYPTIFETEARERTFWKWCQSIGLHAYDFAYIHA